MSDSALEPTLPARAVSAFAQYRALLDRYLRPQKGRVIVLSVLLLAGIAAQLANPQVIRYFLDTAQRGAGINENEGMRALTTAAVLFIGFAILQQALTLLATYTGDNVGWTATNRLRADLTLHVLRLDMPFHKQHTPGELIERVDGDVSKLAGFFSQFVVQVLGNALLALGILVLLARENLWVGLGLTAYVLLISLPVGRLQKLAVSRWVADRQVSADLFGFIEERISGAEEIRAAGAEAHNMRRLHALMRVFLEKVRSAWMVTRLAYNLTNLMYVAAYAFGLMVGGLLYMRGEASLGTAYLIVSYIGMLEQPIQHLREQIQDLQQASASVQRIEALRQLEPAVSDPPPAERQSLPDGALSAAFERVSFHYEDNLPVLHEVSFEVTPGRVLGVLGRTGSGKSTLTRLLFRLYDPAAGAVCLDGIDIRRTALGDLRRRVGMVTQDVQLFQASVRDNLTFFDPSIPDARLEQVLKDLRLWDWVQSLPQGLATPLEAGGGGLSAGEAQLLAFTRVFLRDPGLVILDEASSRLDPSTEALMERAVGRLFAGRTGVVIAHRLKTVQRADDILILEAGKVAEYGAREALARDPRSRFYSLLQTGLEEALA